MTSSKRLVGIVGFGQLGQYLVDRVLESDTLGLAFVWNRNASVLSGKIDEKYILKDLLEFASRGAELIVEVAHPCISRDYGKLFLEQADYLVGSPTAFADPSLEVALREGALQHALYIPAGAFWGGEDVKKMADSGTLQALQVSMTKHPQSFKLTGHLKQLNESVESSLVTLFEGPVRELCSLAPNNVNTMATAAIAAHNLGFDKVQGRLISDPAMTHWHIVEIDAWGPGDMAVGSAFHVHTLRRNPAKPGAVTGNATYASFFSSILSAQGKSNGVHLC